MPFRRILRQGITTMMRTEFEFEPIGVVRSGFKEKFGIPRQSRLAKSARAEIRLPLAKFRDAIDGLEDFSHLWIIFVFHQADERQSPGQTPATGRGQETRRLRHALASPPEPDRNVRRRTRSDRKEHQKKSIIHIRGADLLDGTPVLDIKPYVPYADSIPRARAAWAETPRKKLKVVCSRKALTSVEPRIRRGTRAQAIDFRGSGPRSQPGISRSRRGLCLSSRGVRRPLVIQGENVRVQTLKSL